MSLSEHMCVPLLPHRAKGCPRTPMPGDEPEERFGVVKEGGTATPHSWLQEKEMNQGGQKGRGVPCSVRKHQQTCKESVRHDQKCNPLPPWSSPVSHHQKCSSAQHHAFLVPSPATPRAIFGSRHLPLGSTHFGKHPGGGVSSGPKQAKTLSRCPL